MRLKIAFFFIVNTCLLNAQVEQKESVASASSGVSCSQTIEGEIRDKISNKLLEGAEVVLLDKDGALVATQTVKEDAKFLFKISCETSYLLEGKMQEYTAESKQFTTSNKNGRVLRLLIFLDKGEIDFVTDSEANAQSIDSIVIAEITKSDSTPDIRPEEIPQLVTEVTPIKEEEAVAAVEVEKPIKGITIDPIYFDYESSYLNPKAKRELQKVIVLMKQNPEMKLECAGYTDAKGATEYNMWMSDRRAARVVDYLLKRGISAARISGKGYGETKLVNSCTNEVDCTDKERAANRRTEFVIVEM
tara:strand:- start:103213 stop:104124 length:912 start_codon:yes stop_codon:yes gene_type:complete